MDKLKGESLDGINGIGFLIKGRMNRCLTSSAVFVLLYMIIGLILNLDLEAKNFLESFIQVFFYSAIGFIGTINKQIPHVSSDVSNQLILLYGSLTISLLTSTWKYLNAFIDSAGTNEGENRIILGLARKIAFLCYALFIDVFSQLIALESGKTFLRVFAEHGNENDTFWFIVIGTMAIASTLIPMFLLRKFFREFFDEAIRTSIFGIMAFPFIVDAMQKGTNGSLYIIVVLIVFSYIADGIVKFLEKIGIIKPIREFVWEYGGWSLSRASFIRSFTLFGIICWLFGRSRD